MLQKMHYSLYDNDFLDYLQLFVDPPLKKACTSDTVKYMK